MAQKLLRFDFTELLCQFGTCAIHVEGKLVVG